MKFAFVSHVLPPSWSGQAVMIHRVLGGVDPADYCLITRQEEPAAAAAEPSATGRLPAKYYHLPSDEILRRGSRFGMAKWRTRANLLPAIAWRARRIARIARREGCGAVVACTGDLLNLPAGYLAARILKVPFYPYLFDDYATQWIEPFDRRVARAFEPRLMRDAAHVIAPNEFMRDEIMRRYGVEPAVIHNPCDLSLYDFGGARESSAQGEGESSAGARGSSPEGEGGPSAEEAGRIVYTGAVSIASHADAFVNLMRALEILNRPGVKLHLYSAQPADYLAEHGISGPLEHHAHHAADSMPGVQRRADVLFLPLAFRSPYPVLINTSCPSKMGEYMASGRAILAHAPAGSFVAWYLKKYECGLVVDESDPAKLAAAVERLLGDADLRRRLGERARERAVGDFSTDIARARFAELLGLEAPRGQKPARAGVA